MSPPLPEQSGWTCCVLGASLGQQSESAAFPFHYEMLMILTSLGSNGC